MVQTRLTLYSWSTDIRSVVLVCVFFLICMMYKLSLYVFFFFFFLQPPSSNDSIPEEAQYKVQPNVIPLYCTNKVQMCSLSS